MKRIWLVMLKQSAMAVAVVSLAGVLWDHFYQPSYNREPLSSGALAVFGYLVILLGFSILNAVTGALYLWLFAQSDLSDLVLDDLRRINLPAPRAGDGKTYEYLIDIAEDEGVAFGDRLQAACLYGIYKGSMKGGMFRSLAFRKAIDAAMLRYYQEAPQRH